MGHGCYGIAETLRGMMALKSGFSVSVGFLCCGNDNLHDAGCYHQPELPQQGSRTSGRDEAGIAETLNRGDAERAEARNPDFRGSFRVRASAILDGGIRQHE